jgi:hypothetical protein
MTIRAADDFETIRARLDELRAAREIKGAARVSPALSNAEALHAGDMTVLEALVAEGLLMGAMATGWPEVVVIDYLPIRWECIAPGFLDAPPLFHPIPLRARAHACEGIWVEPDPSLASPRVEEPVSARSEFQERGRARAGKAW